MKNFSNCLSATNRPMKSSTTLAIPSYPPSLSYKVFSCALVLEVLRESKREKKTANIVARLNMCTLLLSSKKAIWTYVEASRVGCIQSEPKWDSSGFSKSSQPQTKDPTLPRFGSDSMLAAKINRHRWTFAAALRFESDGDCGRLQGNIGQLILQHALATTIS